MSFSVRFFSLFLLLLCLGLSGCYDKSIRHLASDAALIKVGSSTKTDVLTYLGEPDEQNILSQEKEQWVYKEEKITMPQRFPIIGSFFNSNGYDTIEVILENGVVKACQFREMAGDEFDWADDFSWQEKKE